MGSRATRRNAFTHLPTLGEGFQPVSEKGTALVSANAKETVASVGARPKPVAGRRITRGLAKSQGLSIPPWGTPTAAEKSTRGKRTNAELYEEDAPGIRVGDKFQATNIPCLLTAKQKEKHAILGGRDDGVLENDGTDAIRNRYSGCADADKLAWQPAPNAISREVAEQYIQVASKSFGMPAEESLEILFSRGYDPDKALKDIAERTAPTPSLWTLEEVALFEDAFCIYEKDFKSMQREMIPDKTVNELRAFYYRWNSWNLQFKIPE